MAALFNHKARLARERQSGSEPVRCNDWWRRRESNPRPRAVKRGSYMLVSPFLSRPRSARRAGNECGPACLVFVHCGQAVRGTLARLNDTSSAGSSNRAERRSRAFRPRGRVRCCSQLLLFDRFYEAISSACNHRPDVSPSKPVRPQFVNELHRKTGGMMRAFRGMNFAEIDAIVRRALAEDLPDV